MQKIIPVLILILVIQIGAYAQTSSFRISGNGFGPVKTGMTRIQVGKALGAKMFSLDGDPPSGCKYYKARRGFAGISFMISEGSMARVDTTSRAYRTAEGARVGDTEARIKRLYRGRVKIEPHKYIDGHYLIVGDTKRAIIFETDGKKVLMIRAGRYPEAEWVEGCS
jgi:hypothetical protein